MPVETLISVAFSVVKLVVVIVSQEIQLAANLQSELEKLRLTVSAITALLHEAEKRRVLTEDVKDWLEKLKDAVYDADDLLDDVLTEALRCRRNTVRGKWFSSSNKLSNARSITLQVKEITDRIDAVTTDRVRFQLERAGSSSSLGSFLVEEPSKLRITYPFESEPYLIGREKDKKEVIKFLLDPNFDENVSSLPVVGHGGMGKTTLARLVFNDKTVQEYFELKLWICVSTNFDLEDILRKMVRECSSGERLGKIPEDMNELWTTLGDALNGKRYLLVLDDVWNENLREWLKLHKFLVNGGRRGSKVLVTARTLRAATTMSTTTDVYRLSGLSEDESLNLLMRVAKKQEEEWKNRNLGKMAKEILKKCDGVPLAITTVGRLLLVKRNTEEGWSNFLNKDLWQINQEEGDILPSLKLSYDSLPSHLKQCFIYCSLFPKGYELDPSELVRLWMAQGFVKPVGDRQTPEVAGQEYFMELVSRSFLQEIEEDLYGNIRKCKMNDLMHDLARSVSEDHCFTVDISHGRKIPERARHLSVVNMEQAPHELNELERNTRIRSLLLITKNSTNVKIPHLDVLGFTSLRALRLDNILLDVIPDLICKLKHLRSLDLSGNTELRSLPNSISELCHLETLNLRGCCCLERLPEGITELGNLSQLDVGECSSLLHMPKGIGKLTKLQMLSTFVVGEKGNLDAAPLDELSRLAGLRKGLAVRELKRIESISDNKVDNSLVVTSCHLQYLGLHWGSHEDRENDPEVLERFRPHPDLRGLGIEGFGGVGLSSWISHLHNLVEIKISLCSQCIYLPPLDHLHFLKRVWVSELRKLEFIELSDSGIFDDSFFPSLVEIHLSYLDEFTGWRRRSRTEEENNLPEGSLPMLLIPNFSDKIIVEITGCPKFSYVHGGWLRLRGTSEKVLHQLLRTTPETVPVDPLMKTARNFTFRICLALLTCLTIEGLEDAEQLPLELFKFLPSLNSLKIISCPRLRSLPIRWILSHLTWLEKLQIDDCKELVLDLA